MKVGIGNPDWSSWSHQVLFAPCCHDAGPPRWGGWVFAMLQHDFYYKWNNLHPTKASAHYVLWFVQCSRLHDNCSKKTTRYNTKTSLSKQQTQFTTYCKSTCFVCCVLCTKVVTRCKMSSGFHSGSVEWTILLATSPAADRRALPLCH